MTSAELEKYSELIRQFRENLELSAEENSDEFILAWLRVENYDLQNAEENFRVQMSFEQLLFPQNDDPIFKKERKRIKDLINTYWSMTYLGFDKEDYPFILVSWKEFDLPGYPYIFSSYDYCFVRYFVHHKFLKLHYERRKQIGKKDEYAVTYIADSQLPYEKFVDKKVLDSFLSHTKLSTMIYPGTLRRLIAVNVPLVMFSVYPLVKAVIRSDMLDKIVWCDKDSTAEEALKYIDADVLPAYLGGVRLDKKGDPLCQDFIKPGRKFPEELYLTNIVRLSPSDPRVTEITVPAQQLEDVEVIIEKPKSKIHIQFSGSDYIYFQVLFRKSLQNFAKNDKCDSKLFDEEKLSPSIKILANIAPMNSFLHCFKAGTYILRFDNTSSWMTAVTVTYKIEVID